MSKLKSIFISSLPTIIIAGLVVTSIIYAWKEPEKAPPQGNVDAPINISTTTQRKAGSLEIGGFLNVDSGSIMGHTLSDTPGACSGVDCVGLIVEHGKVGIGTIDPEAKLHIDSTSTTTSPLIVKGIINGFSSELMTGWNYRKPIIVNNNTSESLTDYQVLVNLDTKNLISAGKMKNDCSDIRFTDNDGKALLEHWLESDCNTVSTKVWVKVPSISSQSNKTIYVYYGNFGASSISSASNTFFKDKIFLVTGDCINSEVCGYTDTHNEFDAIRERIGESIYKIHKYSGYVTKIDHLFEIRFSSTGVLSYVENPDYYFSRYRFLFIPSKTDTYSFGTNSDDASEVAIFPFDGYGGGMKTTHPYGQHEVVAYWYGPHGGGTCGSSGTVHSKKLIAGKGYWIDYIQTEWGGAQLSHMCIKDDSGWKDLSTDNFPGMIFARNYVTPEPTIEVKEEERRGTVEESSDTILYIAPQTGNIGIGTDSPQSKLDVRNGQINTENLCINNNCKKDWEEVAASSVRYIEQFNDGQKIESSRQRVHYHIEATKEKVGTTVPIDQNILEELCSDRDGCEITIGMRHWSDDQPGLTASRGPYKFFLSSIPSGVGNDNYGWRMTGLGGGDTYSEGKDQDGVLGHVIQGWDCYFTDGEYKNFNYSDNRKGFGLLNWNQQYNNKNMVCTLDIEGIRSTDFGHLYSPEYKEYFPLVYQRHTISECELSGGKLVKTQDGSYTDQDFCKKNPEKCFCRFDRSGCPDGWSRYQNWSTTAVGSCFSGARGCGTHHNGVAALCATGSHTWSNTPQEVCQGGGTDWYATIYYGIWKCKSRHIDCWAKAPFTEIGCY